MNNLNIVLILFSLTMIFAKIQQDPFTSGWTTFSQDLISINFIVIFSLLLFTILFLVRLAVNSKNMKYKIAFLVFAIIIGTGFIFQIHFQPDDEIVLSLFAYHSVINGINPYAQNYTSSLLPALSVIRVGPTYTASGAVIGTFGYPILYLLVQIPFFIIFNPTPLSLQQWVMPTEYAVFFAFFVLVIYLLTKEKQNQLPIYSAVILVSFVFLVFSSVAILLMLTLILFMFTTIGKKYSWLVLGLMASLQQQLWILVILFIVYEFKEYGLNKPFSSLIGSSLIFLLLNGYFIAINPHAFIYNFLNFGQLMPNYVSPLGSLLVLYGVPSSIILFFFVMAILVVISATMVSEYRFIPLLSAIPYLFVTHSLPVYYILPFAVYGLIQ